MKFIILIIGIMIFLVYTIPLISAKINLGNIFGILVGLILITIAMLYKKLLILYNTDIGRIIIIICLIMAVIFLFAFAGTMVKIIIGTKKTAKNEKAIIVLGCRVKGDIPTKALTSRCRAAYEHLKIVQGSFAILSGGQGADESISEAECMRRILLSMGIEEDRLILEDKSTSTQENFEFSKEILDKLDYNDCVAVATSEYHEYRARLIAQRYNLETSSLPGHSIRFLRIPAFTREVFGIWLLMIKNK